MRSLRSSTIFLFSFTLVIYRLSYIRSNESSESEEFYEKYYGKTFEDYYVEHFGTSPTEFRAWDKLRDWFTKEKIEDVKRYCAEIHKRAGNGTIVVKDVYLKERCLSFNQSKYEPRNIDILSYTIDENATYRSYETFSYRKAEEPRHITQGWCPECIYYVTLFRKEGEKEEFRVDRSVCGIPG